MSRPRVTQPALDRSVPGVIFTIGDHTWDYGALATIRTLGRVGVPMYAMVPTLDLPAVSSKYLTEAVLTPTTGEEPEDALVAAMRRTCDVIGRPAVGIAGDDETAVLLARRAASFEGQLLLPQVPPELPARLASKSGLAELCAEAGAPTPRSTTPADWAQLDAFEASATYPLVLKNPEPFSRLVSPGVDRTTRVADRSELEQALSAWQPGNALLVQEFIPEDASEDWYVEALFNDASEPVVVFTGRKLRAYPVSTGIGTLASHHQPRPGRAGNRLRAHHRLRRAGGHGLAAGPPRRPVQAARLQPSARRPVPSVPVDRRHRRGAGAAPGAHWPPGAFRPADRWDPARRGIAGSARLRRGAQVRRRGPAAVPTWSRGAGLVGRRRPPPRAALRPRAGCQGGWPGPAGVTQQRCQLRLCAGPVSAAP